MPRGALHKLRFSPQEQCYTITIGSFTLSQEITATPSAWKEWLDMTPSFAFENRAGEHYTIRKERLKRGDAYWYAYRSIQGRTKKRYLGRMADLSLERLEEIGTLFSTEEQETARFVPTHQQIQTTENPQIASVLTPLLETKLHPPQLPARLVVRPHLLTLLDGGQRQKLTLVQAPAGFGKTTLVTQWIAHRQARAEASRRSFAPIAWISLDPGDNDPIRFWATTITACQTFHPQFGQTALVYLSQAPRMFSSSSLETTLIHLLNDLSRLVQEGILILEDYHLIEHERIHETLAFFIEHLPASLHVVILTRSVPPLPLVRWRASGHLREIQSSHLRFSEEETAIFLQQTLPLDISQEAVSSLHTHLEGWAAGLRLFVLSLQGHMTTQAIEETLTHLHADSTADRTHQPIQEYFMSEVLFALPEQLLLFLLQTSILSRLTGSLCDAVTERQDGAEWLVVVERSGLFLEALEGKDVWYRYHSLWVSAMRAEASRRLGEEALRRLSARASRWYEEHSMLVEAIEAALTAQEFERAARLIEQLNERSSFTEHHTMLRWLKSLPEPLLRTHPALCFHFALAWLFAENNDGSRLKIESVEGLLQMAEKGWQRQGDLVRIGNLYALRATFALLHGNFAPAVAYACQALQFQPLHSEQAEGQAQTFPSAWIDWRCGCFDALGLQAMQDGDFDQAHLFLLEGYHLSLKSKEHVFTRIIGRLLGNVCIELGKLHQAASYYQQTLAEDGERDDDEGEDMIHTLSVVGLARLSYEWNELEKAEQLAREVSEYRFKGSLVHWEEETRMRADLLRILVFYAREEMTATQTLLSALIVRLQSNPDALQLIPEALIWQTRLQIRDGDLAAAQSTLNTIARSENELSPLQQKAIHLLHARLLLAQGETDTALIVLEQLLSFSQQGNHIIRVFEIRLLLALAYAAHQQEQEARHQLSLVLAGTRTEGFMRLFLDEGEPLATLLRKLLPSFTEKPLRAFAQSILHAFTDSCPANSASCNVIKGWLIEPLSAQEQRVLKLLAAGYNNKEIAHELIVSVNTVKDHVKHLYRKLGVNNRLQASKAARSLQSDEPS